MALTKCEIEGTSKIHFKCGCELLLHFQISYDSSGTVVCCKTTTSNLCDRHKNIRIKKIDYDKLIDRISNEYCREITKRYGCSGIETYVLLLKLYNDIIMSNNIDEFAIQ